MATAAAAAGGPSIKLQIVVDKKKNRVMFAEAKKDFVDFIFHILSLPLGAVQRILTKTSSTFGSIGSLQDGLKNLDDQYLENVAKDYLLDHLKAPYWGKNTTLLLPEASWNKTRQFYRCPKCYYRTVSVCQSITCHCSANIVLTQVNLLGPEVDLAVVQGNENGYVKEVAMFMVMDNLLVRPAEPASVICLMNQHSINDVRAVEKREVTFGTAQAIKLLKASVSSKTVLTDVFLGGAAVKAEI